VIADDGERTAVVTDVAGTKPVYYTRHGGEAVWATQSTALADLTGADIDYQAITARMVCPTVSEVCGAATTYTGIWRLPGGHVLHVGADDGTPWIHRYEPPNEQQPFEQAVLALREALMTVVDSRAAISQRLSSDFSGGLDSTSLALLAVRAGRPLLAVTHDDPTSSNDDLRYAKQLATGQPLIAHVIVSDPVGLFFDGMDTAPLTDQPFTDAARWAMRAGYQHRVLTYGSDLHLTGDGGDTLLAASPSYLADLVAARPGQVRTLVRHAAARARLRHLPVHAILASAIALARTPYPQALRQLAADIITPRPRWDRAAATRRLRWCGTAAALAQRGRSSRWFQPGRGGCAFQAAVTGIGVG
jgi:asparagine synthase (glutamine-hydrolysing)